MVLTLIKLTVDAGTPLSGQPPKNAVPQRGDSASYRYLYNELRRGSY
jgi:hypothetical protein